MTNHPSETDDLSPAEIAAKTIATGVKKANLDFWTSFALAVLGGFFVALGAIFSTTVSTNGSDFPYGVNVLLKGLAFSTGLILILVAGAELFTGNNLLILAVLTKNVTLPKMLRNLLVVYLGNMVGAFIIALIMLLSKQYTYGGGAVGKAALSIANTKSGLDFWTALALGVMCNLLVCLAVWMAYSARSTAGKIMAIIPPITAFAAAGFEHSVANMYYISFALFIQRFDPAFTHAAGEFGNLNWNNFFLRNLLPVTIGNLIGGVILVGCAYWFTYLRKQA